VMRGLLVLTVQGRLIRLSGLCGIAAPIFGSSSIFIAIYYSPWFRWTENALSDLGVEGFSAAVFNSGLVFSGFLLLVFSMSLTHLLPSGLLSRIGQGLFSLASVDLCLIGVFSENFGVLHFYVSVLFFTLLPLSLILMGVSLIKSPMYKTLGFIALLSSVLAIGIWLPTWGGVAIPEFISALIGSMWCVVAGFFLIKIDIE
jgi:hypothetical membrane protein